ncbi:OLC1v1005148C1 [Oldenlandia corymbosa var. corymbosa]|uniref:OLC1v1005148C1 n=1 Tax=Oldenlandia corymbosa var. corymbosa TaxID=529605 RepID=A0AAV1DE03_OLDCO|nr:OLC1v1005148C1 [Oldenlandia corymbosa var. corymbosa]
MCPTYCVEHLWNNFKLKHPGLKLKARLTNIAKATTEEEWNKLMDDLKKKHEGGWRARLVNPEKNLIVMLHNIVVMVIRCILDDVKKVEYYADRWYSKEMYLRAYANNIRGMNGPKFWKRISDPPLLPPEFRPLPGKVNGSRNKRHDEPHRVYKNQKGWYEASRKNDGKESERPLDGQKRAAPKQQRGRPRKRVAGEPLADDMGKQKGRGRKALPNSRCEYCKRRGHKPMSCPALKNKLDKKKEATKQDKGKGQQQIQKGARRKRNNKHRGNLQLRDEDENECESAIMVSSTKRKGKNQVADGDKNDPVVLVSISKGKGKFQLCDEDENDTGILVSKTKRKGKKKKQVLDGDENDPMVLVSKSKGKGKFQLRDEDEKDLERILVEDDDEEDFLVIWVSRTRQKGKFQILDEDEGEDVVPVTTSVHGEALSCKYCQMTSHRRAQYPQEQLTRGLENETSDEEYDDAADSALEPCADFSGNFDMDERKDQNEESLKAITAPGELAKATKNNGQLEDVGNSVVAPVLESQPYEGPNKASPAMEMVSNLPFTRKRMGQCSKVNGENLGSSATSPIDIGVEEKDQARNDQSHVDNINSVGVNSGQNLENNLDNCFKLGVGRSRKARYRMHANGAGHSGKNSMQKRANHLALARYLQDDLAPVPHANDHAEIPVLAVPHAEVVVDPLQSHNPQDRLVYPSMAIVIDLPRKLDGGKFVGPSGRVLREKLIRMMIMGSRIGKGLLLTMIPYMPGLLKKMITHPLESLGGNFAGVQLSKVSMKSKVSRTPGVPLLVDYHVNFFFRSWEDM